MMCYDNAILIDDDDDDEICHHKELMMLTTVRMHHMDADKTYRVKARRELHKNATSKSWKHHPTKHQFTDTYLSSKKSSKMNETRRTLLENVWLGFFV